MSQNMFVGVNFNKGSVVTSYGPQLDPWETFTIQRARKTESFLTPSAEGSPLHFGEFVSLHIRRGQAGKWHTVSYCRDTSKTCEANVDHVDSWEFFAMERVSP